MYWELLVCRAIYKQAITESGDTLPTVSAAAGSHAPQAHTPDEN